MRESELRILALRDRLEVAGDDDKGEIIDALESACRQDVLLADFTMRDLTQRPANASRAWAACYLVSGLLSAEVYVQSATLLFKDPEPWIRRMVVESCFYTDSSPPEGVTAAHMVSLARLAIEDTIQGPTGHLKS